MRLSSARASSSRTALKEKPNSRDWRRQAEIIGELARPEPSTSEVADVFASIRQHLDRLQPSR